MPRTLALLLLAFTTIASAENRDPFPSDYTPHACAPAHVCKSWDRSTIIGAGLRHRAVSIDARWMEAHWDELMAALAPICSKIATCYATANNRYLFCNELAQPEMRKICDRYPKGSHDSEQCNSFIIAWAVGVDYESKPIAAEAQKCAAEKAQPGDPRTLEAWTVPATIPIDFNGKVTVYALDPETRVPVDALVVVEGPRLFAPATPDGRPATGWPFAWKATLTRVPNANGHTDLAPPNVTVTAPGYAPVAFRMPVTLPKMVIEMQPKTLKGGKQSVTFTARDAVTGAPVEARVMMGETILGNTNKPLEVEVPKGKRPEIWVTDLFNRYGDVVVVDGGR